MHFVLSSFIKPHSTKIIYLTYIMANNFRNSHWKNEYRNFFYAPTWFLVKVISRVSLSFFLCGSNFNFNFFSHMGNWFCGVCVCVRVCVREMITRLVFTLEEDLFRVLNTFTPNKKRESSDCTRQNATNSCNEKPDFSIFLMMIMVMTVTMMMIMMIIIMMMGCSYQSMRCTAQRKIFQHRRLWNSIILRFKHRTQSIYIYNKSHWIAWSNAWIHTNCATVWEAMLMILDNNNNNNLIHHLNYELAEKYIKWKNEWKSRQLTVVFKTSTKKYQKNWA